MIDLRSDTVTLLLDEMCEAARDAVAGNDMCDDDPTVNKFKARTAELVGKEAMLFVPSGTVGNQIAARTHADPGQRAFVDEKAHAYEWGVDGFAQLSGLQVRTYDAGERAAPTSAQARDHTREESLHVAGMGVLCLENTHNARDGVAIPKADIDAAADTTHDLGIPVRLNDAYLLNIYVTLDEDPTAMVERVDTVICCPSKGLSAPASSMLAGPEAFIEETVHAKKRFGDGIRQAGPIVASGLVVFDSVDRLADDHANATVLAEGLDIVSRLSVPALDTNIVVADSGGTRLTVEEFVELCDDVDILGDTFGWYHTRFTTNLNVSHADVERTVGLTADMVESR